MKHPYLWARYVTVGLGIVGSMACGLLQGAGATPASQTLEKPVATQSNPVQPTQPAAATAAPEATAAVAPTAGNQPNAYYEGISFYYDPSLAKGVSAQTLEASAKASDQMPIFAINPKEFQFDFQGYTVTDGMKPEILVFSPKEYESMITDDPNPVTKELTDLKKLMSDHPADSSGSLPFLPIWNAGQLMHFQLKYLKFQNGEGIRYLTEYGQNFAPLSNNLLFYTFQGQTSDGAYFISAVLPVTHAKLPGDNGETLSAQDFEKFASTYPAYVVDVQNLLNAEKGDSFSPALDKLDALITSIKITK